MVDSAFNTVYHTDTLVSLNGYLLDDIGMMSEYGHLMEYGGINKIYIFHINNNVSKTNKTAERWHYQHL